MKRPIGLIRIIETAALAATLSRAALIANAQHPPVVSQPADASTQATPRQPNSPYASAVGTHTGMKPASGAITGFVYWNMTGFNIPSSCQGLSVQVTTLTKAPASPQILATTNNFTPMGPVTDQSSPGMQKYMLCSYSFNKLPEQIYLRVLVSAPSAQFSPASASAAAFQIPGGNCTKTPSNTLSFILTGGEMLCGDNALNVNLGLTPLSLAARPAGGTTVLLNRPGKPKGLLSNGGTASNLDTTIATPNTVAGVTLLQGQTNAAGGTTSGTQRGLLSTAKTGSDGNLTGAIDGARGYTGRTKPGEKNSAPPGFTGGIQPSGTAGSISSTPLPLSSKDSAGFVPPMPPMSSNAKRDASSPADAATKAQIKSKLRSQLASANQQIRRSARVQPSAALTNVPEIQALQRQMTFLSSLRTQGALTKTALLAPPTQVRMQSPASSNSMLHAPARTKVCLAPQIYSVNGAKSGVVFTQDPKYNDYIITGCSFGTQEGQVYLSGAVTGGRINMVVKTHQWSDTQIEAMVQPGLTGVLDGWPDLIVLPSGGSPAKFPNSRFYAQRESVLLLDIPRQYVTLANVMVGDSTHGFGTNYCPGPDMFPCIAFNAGQPLDGITNGHGESPGPNEQVSNAVDRDGGQLQFNSGQDVYDLSYMASGFQIDYSSVFWYAWTIDVCQGWASDATPKKFGDSVGYDTEGYYNWQEKTKTKIVVDWGVDHCAWRWLGVFRVDDWYNSGYSLQVHVIGPIGIDPWTGQPIPRKHNYGQALPTKLASAP